MKKLKFILLILISIFCLNSCLLTTAAAGTYLLGTMGTYYCAEYGCTRDRTEKDVDGLNIFTKNNPLKVKNYFESIKKRELIKIKVKGNNEVFTVTLPKNFILKKISDGYYLYDKDLVKQRNNVLKEELKNTDPRNPSLERNGTEIQNLEIKNNIYPTNRNINDTIQKLRERVGN